MLFLEHYDINQILMFNIIIHKDIFISGTHSH